MQSLDVAAKYLGKQETTGNNCGPLIDTWCKKLNCPTGIFWCGIFVSNVLMEAYNLADKSSLRKSLGYESPFYADAADDWYKQAGKIGKCQNDPQAGDLFVILDQNGKAEHIGFCASSIVSVDGTFGVHTIEGNTNSGGSRNGDGVYRRFRPVSKSIRFITLPGDLKA